MGQTTSGECGGGSPSGIVKVSRVHKSGHAMKFSEVVEQAIELLRRRERITYRALKREFDLDDEALDDLKAELIDAQRIARDEDGKVLVWVKKGVSGETDKGGNGEDSPESQSVRSPKFKVQSQGTQTLDAVAERRQLTVMFCDLVGS